MQRFRNHLLTLAAGSGLIVADVALRAAIGADAVGIWSAFLLSLGIGLVALAIGWWIVDLIRWALRRTARPRPRIVEVNSGKGNLMPEGKYSWAQVLVKNEGGPAVVRLRVTAIVPHQHMRGSRLRSAGAQQGNGDVLLARDETEGFDLLQVARYRTGIIASSLALVGAYQPISLQTDTEYDFHVQARAGDRVDDAVIVVRILPSGEVRLKLTRVPR